MMPINTPSDGQIKAVLVLAFVGAIAVGLFVGWAAFHFVAALLQYTA